MFTNEGLFNLEDTFKRFILLKLNFKERLWAGTLAHSCPWNIHIHGSQIILNTILFTSWVLSNKNLLPLMGICYLMICIFPSFHSFLSFYMQIDKSLWAWRCESICRRHSQLKEQTQVGVCSTAHLIDWNEQVAAVSWMGMVDWIDEWSDCLAILWPSMAFSL